MGRVANPKREVEAAKVAPAQPVRLHAEIAGETLEQFQPAGPDELRDEVQSLMSSF
jgi:hypothetical protein